MHRKMSSILAVLSVITLCGPVAIAENNKPILREEHRIIVDGVEETWRLEWLNTPTEMAACGPEDEYWDTCPCDGFAFGENGDLMLVRKRSGKKDEHFFLNPLFEYGEHPGPGAALRRWDVTREDRKKLIEMESRNKEDKTKGPQFFAADGLRMRPLARVMEFVDYDHDGRATEFLLQIGTWPCDVKVCVVVGISRNNNRLHVFASANRPKEPLILKSGQWEALSKVKGPVKVPDLLCGDHGSDYEREVELRAHNGKIYATRRTYQCVDKGRRGPLIEEKDF